MLAWTIPWSEEPGGLECIGLQRIVHGWVTEHHRWDFLCGCLFPKTHFFSLLAYSTIADLTPVWNSKLGEGQEETKQRVEEADHSRLVSGRLNKQGNFTHETCLGSHKTSSSQHLPIRILKVYTEALIGFGHIFGPDGLNNTSLSQSCVF